MLYRPSFCSNCGEKIERAVWHVWTSRRFCDVCVSEQPISEYAPKVIVAAALVVSVAGVASFVKPAKVEDVARVANSRSERPAIAASLMSTPAPTTKVDAPVAASPIAPTAKTAVVVEQDVASICGAETKKGTPCSRRVKGNVRCYQHQGMASISTIASQGR